MSDTFDLHELPEGMQLACYGAFFAMAGADGSIDNEEVLTIYESLETSGLSDDGQHTVRTYLLDPPPLEDCLQKLATSPDGLRYGVMLRLVEVARADDVIHPAEAAMMAAGREILGITSEQVTGMETFLGEVDQVRARGVDDEKAREDLKSAASTLAGLGVPVAAIAFSGNVLTLGAAGITAGLAALGLGFGLVPGVGIAMLLGTASFMTVSWALGRGRPGRHQVEAEVREQRVLDNLSSTVGFLSVRLRALDDAGGQPDRVRELRKQLRAIQRLLAQARADAADPEIDTPR